MVNLTDNDAASADGYPFWSPDGSKVGFESNFKAPNTTGPENLYVMDPNAPGQAINAALRLTPYETNAAAVRDAVWSPDGSKVAYNYETGGATGVYVVNADGTSATPTEISATGTQATDPTFSPDGTKIAYSIGQQVYIENADGSSATPQMLPNGQGHSPKWSPDGTKIAFDAPKPFSEVDVHIVNVDGSGTPVILTTTAQFSFATWSPDSQRIAFQDRVSPGDGFFRVANADGTDDHPLVKVQQQNDDSAPSWSPDGSRLTYSAFYHGDDSTTADDVREVHIVNADGTGSDRTLTSGGVNSGHGNADAIWRPAQPAVVPPVQPPLVGPTIKPKLVWITKRIPWTGGYIQPLIVGCSAPSCGENVSAYTSKGVAPPRGPHADVASRDKRKPILVAKAKANLLQGEQKKIKMKVTKIGKALLNQHGSLALNVTVVSTIPGQAQTIDNHKIRVYVPK